MGHTCRAVLDTSRPLGPTLQRTKGALWGDGLLAWLGRPPRDACSALLTGLPHLMPSRPTPTREPTCPVHRAPPSLFWHSSFSSSASALSSPPPPSALQVSHSLLPYTTKYATNGSIDKHIKCALWQTDMCFVTMTILSPQHQDKQYPDEPHHRCPSSMAHVPNGCKLCLSEQRSIGKVYVE